MKNIKITFLVFSMVLMSIAVYGQVINKLGKRIVNNTERTVTDKAEKAAKNAVNNSANENEEANAFSGKEENENKSSAFDTGVDNSTILYVSKQKGNNKNDGSKEAPLKNIDKAINIASPGDEIRVTGGVYMGTLNVGFIESDKPVKIFGSFDESFSKQDIKAHPTLLQPSNESARSTRKAVMKFTHDVAGTVLDNLVFDGGERNAYHPQEGVIESVEGGRLLPPTERPAVGFPTVGEPLLQFVSATTGGDVSVQNCVFVNAASFALQAGHRSGKFTVKNNVFVANKMAAIEIYGTCASTGGPNTMALCGEVEVAYNTIVFSWSRTKDFLDMGYGVRVMTKCDYNIHHNIIGASILAGVDHTRFNKDEWVKVDHNIFFVNKDEDLHYSPASNTRLRINAADFGDLEFASAEGNVNKIPEGLQVNKAYLEGYLNARYSETTDLDRNSPANMWRSMMGMNLQGTMTSSVSMFANKYPWNDALNLFGNVNGYGAQ
ncbi:MAG: right-handed parallel beta-helix repeat-containing protein [Prolixibacteraceae bacterium]|nr:right-handed parallel beta-helix repeat-containing protein [Prolixibacteraceae bacterium]